MRKRKGVNGQPLLSPRDTLKKSRRSSIDKHDKGYKLYAPHDPIDHRVGHLHLKEDKMEEGPTYPVIILG